MVLYSIGHQVVFRLRGWSPCLPAGFLVSHGTPDTTESTSVSCTRLSLFLPDFPKQFHYLRLLRSWSLPREITLPVWARPFSLAATKGFDVFFLFLRLLRCFRSAGSLCMTMYSSCSDSGSHCRVSPFGHPRINGYVLLPVAFRSLSRPSSAPGARASALRPL